MEVSEKEREWLDRRMGFISASELHNLFSASGKFIDGMADYCRHKRFERKHGYVIPFTSRAIEIGKEQERYAFEWLKANVEELKDTLVYAQDLPDIPFWTLPDLHFGASPDTFTEDRKLIVEIKTVVGITDTEYYDDGSIPYEQKRDRVVSEHWAQLAGQLLSSPETEEIWLVKYLPQLDDVDKDTDSPTAPWRGWLFKFRRDEFDLSGLQERIALFDRIIDSGDNLEDVKSDWNKALKDGEKKK